MHPLVQRHSASVSAWGEERLITSIRTWLGEVTPPSPRGMGDDCAVLPPSACRQLLTVDPVIFGRHFDATAKPEEVGAKLLKRNVSDIAAMGGRPRHAVIALTLDPRTSRQWLARFHRGLAQSARQFGVKVVGGDVAQGNGFIASLTLLGTATGARVLTRRGRAVAINSLSLVCSEAVSRPATSGDSLRGSPRGHGSPANLRFAP